ncbi:M9 family metallopeptidase [Kribbella sp. NBC_01245]|uniref:M9 family metallopeptidase n=1 Tax=Kribbella sp. NBC_01245 TaxID=2903578 RepID=UPI002E2D0E19|nr:M9 family metallopeptidase [Kribbella sp. NBC_01245]
MIKPPNVILAAVLAAAVLVPANASAAPTLPAPTPPTPTAPVAVAAALPSRVGVTIRPALRPPTPADPRVVTASAARLPAPQKVAPTQGRLAASCTPGEFGSRTGSALVHFVKASTADCVNTLFNVTGRDAYNVFREAKMVTIAGALRDTNYPGNNSTSVKQLVMFLRAGYYVQYNHPTDVGTYGPALKTAIRSGLDRFFGSAPSRDVSDANGEILGEAVTLIDSSSENARYLYVVRRLLTAFNSQYNELWYMRNAVNNVFTVLFRGHWLDDFKAAVVADPSILDVTYKFTVDNIGLLGTASGFLVANGGGELTRFLDTPALKPKVRPLSKSLLDRSRMTGVTAKLWVRVAELAAHYDNANCSYYKVCDFETALASAVLPIRHTCSSTVTIRAQEISATNLSTTCTSLAGQVSYFHNKVRNSGPVANDNNTSLEVVTFHSSDDYKTYAGVLFDIDTNNGGMYLEGDPAAQGNVPRFIAYEAEWQRPTFAIWNLNHEFTHYLDGRFDMYGDFAAGQVVPAVWWIEGVAEYISYGYRALPYDEALEEAKRHTYSLSTLWQTTYENSNTNRTYRWGYLAARYMLERHPDDVDRMLAKFRVGDYRGGYAIYATGIGTRYDADFNAWLDNISADPTPECTGTDTRVLDRNCRRSNLSATTGNLTHFYIYLPAGVSTLRINAGGGTGNADLYYNPDTWATPTTHTARSTNTTNTESITVTTPTPGYRYISLYATTTFSGTTITTTY